LAEIKKVKVPQSAIDEFAKRMVDDGYFHVSAQLLQVNSLFNVTSIALSMAALLRHGWTATFFNMFDEAWALTELFKAVMEQVTKNRPNMDMLSWYIDPNNGESGFSPHRDRQPPNPATTFDAKTRQPKYSTCWMPLTDACPDNSCLYVLPASKDPGYHTGDTEEDPLMRALTNKEAFQHIKCLPAEAGSVLMFSHRIIHWGSAGRKGYHTPRVAFSSVFSTDDYEKAYFSRTELPFPATALRLALSGGQMMVYYDRFGFSVQELHRYYDMFKRKKDAFDQVSEEPLVVTVIALVFSDCSTCRTTK